jgi:hypothetical protein
MSTARLIFTRRSRGAMLRRALGHVLRLLALLAVVCLVAWPLALARLAS